MKVWTETLPVDNDQPLVTLLVVPTTVVKKTQDFADIWCSLFASIADKTAWSIVQPTGLALFWVLTIRVWNNIFALWWSCWIFKDFDKASLQRCRVVLHISVSNIWYPIHNVYSYALLLPLLRKHLSLCVAYRNAVEANILWGVLWCQNEVRARWVCANISWRFSAFRYIYIYIYIYATCKINIST